MKYIPILFLFLITPLIVESGVKPKIKYGEASGKYQLIEPCYADKSIDESLYDVPDEIQITINKNKTLVFNGSFEDSYTFDAQQIMGGTVISFGGYTKESNGQWPGGGIIEISDEGIYLIWIDGAGQECQSRYKKVKK
jgi:hypothetical protein